MAINLTSSTYHTPPDSDFPYGSLIDDPGNGAGTRFNRNSMQDIFTFFQQLMAHAGTAYSGVLDSEYTEHQYYQAYLNAAYEAQQTPVYGGTYQAHATAPIKFRKRGKTVRVKGSTGNSVPGSITTDQIVFTLPAEFRPLEAQYHNGTDSNTGANIAIQIRTNGDVVLKGTLTTFGSASTYMNIAWDVD